MKRFLAVLAVVLLTGCGRTEQVAGGGSDQPNKIQAGRIFMDSLTPASDAIMESWIGSWDPQNSRGSGVRLDSGISDAQGNWSLRVPDTGNWFVTGRKAEKMAVFKKGQSEARLHTVATYHGTVHVVPGIELVGIWLGGSAGSLALDATGGFSVVTAPGAQRIWASVKWPGGQDTILVKDRFLNPGDNVDSALTVDTGSVLLASAESSPWGSALRGVDYAAMDSNNGFWYTYNDHVVHGGSYVTPGGFPYFDSAVYADFPANTGRFFSWGIYLGPPIALRDSGNIEAYAGIGLQLSRRDLDWSGCDSIQVVVRGVGKVFLQIGTTETDRLDPISMFRFPIVLSNAYAWTVVTIPLDSLRPAPGSGADSMHLTWKRVGHGVHDISFGGGAPYAKLELREVRVLGSRVKHW